jgi:polyferredoxin
MHFELSPDTAQLSGERVDYFLVSVRSDQRGQREGLFVFSSLGRGGQEVGPLAYNRVPILFSLMSEAELNKARLVHLLRHRHNGPYLAVSQRRGPPLATVRVSTCLECHEAGSGVRTGTAQLAREQSCLVCHRELAASPPIASGRCPVCGMENCQMGCVTRGTTQSGQAVMRMAGIPRPLFLGAVGLVLIISFCLVEYLNRGPLRRGDYRWDILSLRIVAWCFRQPWLKPLLQVPIFVLFCFLIYAGFAGDQVVNITPVLTWTVWWAGLIFLVLFLGKAWCYVCPWDFAATLAQSIGRLWGSRKPFTLGLGWPRALRNIYLATGLFVALTWLELGYQITASPRATAVLALVMVALSVVPALLFDKRSFCRYGCMIGRVSGLYAMFAPVEVRCKDLDVCRRCRTHDCFRGNETIPACPTALSLPAMRENTYCIQCGYCVRSCPSQNVAFNLRPFAADLTSLRRPRWDESLLAIILLALTSFHGLTMTPLWDSSAGTSVIAALRGALGVGPLAAFSVGMAAVVVTPMLFYCALCSITQRLAGDPAISWRKLFLYYAYSLLPVALFYHLAHNAMHFFMEGQYLLPVLSDPLGRGWNLFSTAALRPGPILSAHTIWWLQVALIIVGHIFGVIIAHHASRKLYAAPHRAALSLLPMLTGMVLYSWASLWLLHMDMNMRSSML